MAESRNIPSLRFELRSPSFTVKLLIILSRSFPLMKILPAEMRDHARRFNWLQIAYTVEFTSRNKDIFAFEGIAFENYNISVISDDLIFHPLKNQKRKISSQEMERYVKIFTCNSSIYIFLLRDRNANFNWQVARSLDLILAIKCTSWREDFCQTARAHVFPSRAQTSMYAE